MQIQNTKTDTVLPRTRRFELVVASATSASIKHKKDHKAPTVMSYVILQAVAYLPFFSNDGRWVASG